MMNRANRASDDRPDDATHDATSNAVGDALLAYFDATPDERDGEAPSHDLWPAIESRLSPAVLPFGARRTTRRFPAWTSLLLAASVLVAATAGVTYTATMYRARAAQQREMASVTPPTASVADPDAGTMNAMTRGGIPVVEVANRNPQDGSPDVYDREIASLQETLRDKRSQLKPETVQTIEDNLKIIDDAIRNTRAALAKDPASKLLAKQLERTRAKKVALLRTAALLPASA